MTDDEADKADMLSLLGGLSIIWISGFVIGVFLTIILIQGGKMRDIVDIVNDILEEVGDWESATKDELIKDLLMGECSDAAIEKYANKIGVDCNE